ncbi:MAG: TIGR03621 family F420-dependent LLM class oxidoreductase, partial [Acidimicrobiia bacterium]|nr:TIGR03621 family F420-dependent LLM class oxidoreductase [Acidimicrobiia bacterium]
TARRVEDAGFSTLFMPDHFEDQLAPVPALAAAAAVTSTLRVGSLVFGNDFRHPVVLAKEMATIDVLSGGRLELGIGAGWLRTDYDEAGMPYDRPGVRIERLAESLAIMKGLMSDGPFSFEGEHYSISELDGLPKPHAGVPPIVIGGGGKRMLTFAAQHADIVGITANLHTGEVGEDVIDDLSMGDRYDQKVAWVRDAAGDRDIELSSLTMAGWLVFTDDKATTAEGVAARVGVTTERILDTPAVLIGSPGEIADTLRARRERWGFSYPVLQTPDDWDSAVAVVSELTGT